MFGVYCQVVEPPSLSEGLNLLPVGHRQMIESYAKSMSKKFLDGGVSPELGAIVSDAGTNPVGLDLIGKAFEDWCAWTGHGLLLWFLCTVLVRG